MNRRSFIAAAIAAGLTPAAAIAAAAKYKPGMVEKALANGETVFLDFTATWCGTCQSQGRTIRSLWSENPAYEKNVTFIDVDWDTYKGAKLTKDLKIPRRSTLVVLKGDQELGRIVAGTRRKQIKALMDTALNAATA